MAAATVSHFARSAGSPPHAPSSAMPSPSRRSTGTHAVADSNGAATVNASSPASTRPRSTRHASGLGQSVAQSPESTGSKAGLDAPPRSHSARQQAVLDNKNGAASPNQQLNAAGESSAATSTTTARERRIPSRSSSLQDIKGKGVEKKDSFSPPTDEEERRRAVEKILRRTQAAKVRQNDLTLGRQWACPVTVWLHRHHLLTLACPRQTARNFRNRLALASFKAQRGWQDADFGSIEAHIEQQTQQLQQQPTFGYTHPPRPGQIVYGSMPPPMSEAYAADTPFFGHAPLPMSVSYASTSAAPYDSIALRGPAQLAPSSDAHQRQKRRMTVGDPNGRTALSRTSSSSSGETGAHRRHSLSSGPKPGSPRSRVPPRKQQLPATSRPLSSSDPTFSSFVDAAAALTGLSRGPPDPNVISGDDGDRPGIAGTIPNGRAATPDREKGNTSASAEGAAELMLFLAASPSPVQTRANVSAPAMGGDGSALKGRRLFSGVEGMSSGPHAHAVSESSPLSARLQGSPSHLAPASAISPHRSPPARFSPTGSPFADGTEGPSKTSQHYSVLSSAAPHGSMSSVAPFAPSTVSMSGPSTLPAIPSTPGRDRQASGSGWEHFLNVSPSPQRPTFDRSALGRRSLEDVERGSYDEVAIAGPSDYENEGVSSSAPTSTALIGNMTRSSAPFATSSTASPGMAATNAQQTHQSPF